MRSPARLRMTAALCEAALAASARVYGDDPADALSAPRNTKGGRCLPAAASGLARALNAQLECATSVWRLNLGSVRSARQRAEGRFSEAEAAAIAAVRDLVDPPATSRPCTAGLDPVPPAAPEAPRRSWPPPATAPGGRLTVLPPRPAARPFESLDERVAGQLRAGPASSRDLATILGAKETAVDQALRGLRAAGLCACDPIPPAGPRAQAWRLIPQPEKDL